MKFTAIVQHFYPQRRKYLTDIVCKISETSPHEVLLWNNGFSFDGWQTDPRVHENVKEVKSERNTLLGRYAAAFIAETDLIYVQDDDLIVEPDTIRRLVAAAEVYPNKIVGIGGCTLAWGSKKPYSEARWVPEGRCDVIQGRAWACHRGALALGFSRILTEGIQPTRSDDIFFSMAGDGGFVVPGKFTNLDEEGVGLSHAPEHFQERDEFARMMIG